MKLIHRLLGRGDEGRGRELLDDARELSRERRRSRGRLYAGLRMSWDLASIAGRRGARVAEAGTRRPPMGRVVNDLRQAGRALRRRPLVSLVAVASLAVGLGLALLTFTVADAILVRPLAFPEGDRLLAVYTTFRPESGANFPRAALSPPEVLDFGAQSLTVEVGAYQFEAVAITDGVEAPERVPGARLTSSAFRILGTAPAMGRVFNAGDDRPGAPCVAVISHGLWAERFGARPDIASQTTVVNGAPCAIVGVMPPGFVFPAQTSRIWLPLAVDPDPNGRGSHGVFAVGRLKDGATLEQADRELAALMARWAEAMPHHRGHSVVIVPLKEDLVGPVSQELRILASAVGLLVLAIAANLSSLLLAHGHARRRELAVRSAMGASRPSLIRQLLFEGWLLAAAGGAIGGLLASWAIAPMVAAYPAALPRAGEIQFDWRVAAIGVVIATVIGVLMAVLPAIRLTRRFTSRDLSTGTRGAGSSLTLRTERALVIGELAIGAAVAVCALLLTASYARLSRVALGFDGGGVTAGVVAVPDRGPRDPGWPLRFYDELIGRLRATPGITNAGAISSMPLVSFPPPDLFTIEGRPVAPPSEPGFIADYVMVTPGLLETLRIDVLSGRGIETTDTAASGAVAVINEALVRSQFAGVDPIGRRIRYPEAVEGDRWTRWGPWITIVGIVRDIRSIAPSMAPRPAIYVAHAQRPRSGYDGRTMGVVIHAASTSVDVAGVVRRYVRDLDPGASLSTLRAMDAIVGGAVARPRFMSGIMTVFAAIALLVAALGVYSVVACGVERRTREIGLRLALGATRRRIAAGIGRHTAVMLAAGLGLGLLGAGGLAISMRTMLFGVTPFTPAPYAIVAAVLTAAVAIAAALPARRAMRVDPLTTLRSE